MTTATLPNQNYRLSFFGAPEPDLKRGFKVAIPLGIATLILAYVVPKPTPDDLTVDEVPDRFAKLILEEPKAPPAPVKVPEPPAATVKPIEAPKPVEVAKTEPVQHARRTPKPTISEDRGQAGRERAKKEVEQQLATVATSLENVLSDVSKSLASTDDGTPKTVVPQRRKTRGGRSAAQLASVGTAVPTIDAPTGNGGAISGSKIEIEGGGDGGLVSESWVGDPSSPKGSGGAAPQSLRSDQQLLGVVRKYAAGIQFCYDNELKKQAGLGGKLVVSITVAAAGNVSNAVVVKDTVGSKALVTCALAQIEAWRFPSIPEGTVTFQAPFVFTPPE
ncbi:MAG: TonB family protein [bacterium]